MGRVTNVSDPRQRQTANGAGYVAYTAATNARPLINDQEPSTTLHRIYACGSRRVERNEEPSWMDEGDLVYVKADWQIERQTVWPSGTETTKVQQPPTPRVMSSRRKYASTRMGLLNSISFCGCPCVRCHCWSQMTSRCCSAIGQTQIPVRIRSSSLDDRLGDDAVDFCSLSVADVGHLGGKKSSALLPLYPPTLRWSCAPCIRCAFPCTFGALEELSRVKECIFAAQRLDAAQERMMPCIRPA